MDIGSTPRPGDCPGAAEHAIPVKPIDTFGLRWTALLERAAASSHPLRLAVTGGGASRGRTRPFRPEEAHRLFRDKGRDPGESGSSVSAGMVSCPRSRRSAYGGWPASSSSRGVEVLNGTPVVGRGARPLRLADGGVVEADEILWATQAGAAPWLRETGLELDDEGFIKVDASLRSTNDPAIFAAGDVAAVNGHPRPKAGVFAVRQGAPLAANLRRTLLGEPLEAFTPQTSYLCLIGEGDGRAVAARGRWSAEGRWLWRIKDWIDRGFMRKFQELPPMKPSAPALTLPEDKAPGLDVLRAASLMRCGGCGAKVGADALRRVLDRLGLNRQRPTRGRPDRPRRPRRRGGDHASCGQGAGANDRISFAR